MVWVRCFYITADAIWQKPVLLTDEFVFKTESGTFDLLSTNPTYYEPYPRFFEQRLLIGTKKQLKIAQT